MHRCPREANQAARRDGPSKPRQRELEQLERAGRWPALMGAQIGASDPTESR